MTNYLIWGFAIIAIIIVIGLIVFGINSNKNNSNNVDINPSPKPPARRGLIEIVDTGDKTTCMKKYSKNTVDLEFTFCAKVKYSAEYYVQRVDLDEQGWKGKATITSQTESPYELRSYIDYDAEDCKYTLTLVNSDGDVITFNRPSRCITVKTKLHKVCDKRSSISSGTSCSESVSECPSSRGSNSRGSSSRGSSSRGSSSRGSQHDSDDCESQGTCGDSVDPYANSSHCESMTSLNFFPDSQSCVSAA